MLNKKLSQQQTVELLSTLKTRFQNNGYRHKGLDWSQVEAKLQEESSVGKLWSLHEMERTGGEPDVVILKKATEEIVFCDCSPESPAGRRSTCYDQAGLESRKDNRPLTNAIDMAGEMAIQLLNEEEYNQLQLLHPDNKKLDSKTSSWIMTPDFVRKLGGALFCDYRFGRVFVYHNGAQSYYGARGFRGLFKI